MRRQTSIRDALRGRLRQLRALVRRSAVERELAEELAYHLELETLANERRGLSPAAARRAALVEFGGAERFAERVREVRWTRWLEDAARDARYGARGLARRPAFAAAAVLTLALGIGANAALYGLLDALVYRMPAGVAASDRLVRVENRGRFERLAHADLRDLTAGAAGAVTLAGWQSTAVALGSGGAPVRVSAELVSASYFEVLGLAPVRGRFFDASEDEVPGRDAVVVLGHALWRDRFGGADDAIGATAVINGHAFTIIGVAPPWFGGLDLEDRAELWVPFMAQPLAMPRAWDVLNSRETPSVAAVGRLGPGVSPAGATAALGVAASRLPEGQRFVPVDPVATPLRGWLQPSSLASGVPVLAFAAILTGLVLLICCANVANLQLSRAIGRSRELAVRLALGAGRGRVVRMLLTESLLLAALAGAAGLAVAVGLARWLQLRFGGPIAVLDVRPDGDTLLFAFVVAIVAGLLFGLLPAVRAARPDVLPTMKGDARPWLRRGRGRALLAGAQVALSLVLLVATGLFLGRLRQLQRVDVGFDASRIAAFSVDLHAHGYGEAERAAFLEELVRRIARVPGVADATGPTAVPLGSGVALVGVSLPDEAPPPAPPTGDATVTRAEHAAMLRTGTAAAAVGVAPEFFRVLGVPVVRGRALEPADFGEGAELVAVVSDALATRLWRGADAIGRTVLVGDRAARVVGAVRALPLSHMAEPQPLQVFLPESRHFQLAAQSVLVRLDGDPDSALPALRAEARRLDPTVPVFDLHLIAGRIEEQLAVQRSLTRLVGGFGLLALTLCLVGLYGVIASAVAARRREIGVRIALGARAAEVTGLFVRQGARVALYGVAAGALLALAVGRLISSVVWGVRPFEPATLAAATAALLAAALAASWLPARRAARIDPVTTLREE